MTNNWTNWLNIKCSCNYHGPAIYKVRLVGTSGIPCQLKRFLKPDQECIMCIGNTSNMEVRRKKMLSGVVKAKGHSEMNLVFYLKKYTFFQKLFKGTEFEYSFCKCSNVAESKEKEEKLIKSYFKDFGEVPPLNSVIPNRYGSWDC